MSKISHLLLKDPVVVPTGATLIEAAKLMEKNKVASVLVSRNNKLAGIVSAVDIAYCFTNKQDAAVNEIMHSPEVTISSDKWITDALEMLRRCNISHIAVVEDGERVGIIRAEDILHTYRFNNDKNLRGRKNDAHPFP